MSATHSSLVKNTALLLINKASLVLSSFILLPVFTAHFSAGDYGLVSLITGYIALLAPVLTLRLDIGIFRHIVDARGDVRQLEKVVSSFVFIIIPIMLLVLGLAVIVGSLFSIPFYTLAVVNIITAILFTMATQLIRGVGRTDIFVVTSILVTLLSFIASLYGVLALKAGIEIIFIAAIISQVIGALILGIKGNIVRYISRGSVDRAMQKQLVKYSLPLVPDSMSFWVINISDRTILSIFLGVASAGVYTVANKFSAIIEQAIGVFFQAWTESATVYAKEKERDRLYSDVFSAYMRIFVTLALLTTAIMPFVFSLFIKGVEFQSAYLYIPILMYGMIFHAAEAFISSIYLANDLTKQVAKTTIFGAIINIVVNVVLVLAIGIWAAAISTLIAYAATAVYRYYNVRTYGINLRIASSLCIVSLILAGGNALLYYWNHPIGNYVSIAIILLAGYFLNTASIAWAWHQLKSKSSKQRGAR